MKKLILKRIEELRERENGFSRSLMRWQSPLTHGLYADSINFSELDNESLLFLFERLVIRCSKQM